MSITVAHSRASDMAFYNALIQLDLEMRECWRTKERRQAEALHKILLELCTYAVGRMPGLSDSFQEYIDSGSQEAMHTFVIGWLGASLEVD